MEDKTNNTAELATYAHKKFCSFMAEVLGIDNPFPIDEEAPCNDVEAWIDGHFTEYQRTVGEEEAVDIPGFVSNGLLEGFISAEYFLAYMNIVGGIPGGDYLRRNVEVDMEKLEELVNRNEPEDEQIDAWKCMKGLEAAGAVILLDKSSDGKTRRYYLPLCRPHALVDEEIDESIEQARAEWFRYRSLNNEEKEILSRFTILDDETGQLEEYVIPRHPKSKH